MNILNSSSARNLSPKEASGRMLVGFRTSGAWSRRPSFLFRYRLPRELNCSLSESQFLQYHDEFLPWLQRKSGVEISSVLSIGHSVFGRSLFASNAIRAGDCILKVPFSVHLTPENVLPEVNSLLGDDIGNVARLALVILVEQRMGQDSNWAPYIMSLPQPGELHSTIFWNKEELEMIGLSPVYKETIYQLAQIEREFFAIRPVLDCFPQFFDNISHKDFIHAYGLVGSRAWGSSKGLSLIPFADFLNHDGVSEAVLLTNEDEQISEVIADRDYIYGEQVLIRYGKFPNSTLLLDFGFTVPNNIHDQVQISVDFPKHDSLSSMKAELLHKYCMPIVKDNKRSNSLQNSFIIKEVRSVRGKGKGIPQSLRAVARVLCSSSPEELKDLDDEAVRGDGRLARHPLKNTNREIQAHHFLMSQILRLIKKYDASIKSLRCSNHPLTPSTGKYLAVRRQMAQDLLTGELRVLKSAHAWLNNYCDALSMRSYHLLENG